jgi:FAD/FMN-containing dehydrogenase
MQQWHDWDSTVRCNPQAIKYPVDEAEVVAIVTGALRSDDVVRVFGAGHSWSALVPSQGVLVNLDNLAAPVNIDRELATAQISAGLRIRDIGPLLEKHGLTMSNVGAITPQSIAGAIGTGTHGTGLTYGSIGGEISAIRIVDGRGEIKDYTAAAHPVEMSALRLSLGSLGILVRVTINCVPDHHVELTKIPMGFEEFIDGLEDLYRQNERVRAYWFPGSERVFVNTMNTTDKPLSPGPVYSWFESVIERRLLLGALWGLGRNVNGLIPAMNALQQSIGYKPGSVVGRCFDAITTPMPPFHQESEVAVPIEDAAKAIREYAAFVKRNGLQVNVESEIRFSKSEDILLSPSYGCDVCYIGGYNATYKPNDPFFQMFCGDFQDRFGARPHWGKLGAANRQIAQRLFPGFAKFEQIRRDFDPRGVFANNYIRELFDIP